MSEGIRDESDRLGRTKKVGREKEQGIRRRIRKVVRRTWGKSQTKGMKEDEAGCLRDGVRSEVGLVSKEDIDERYSRWI